MTVAAELSRLLLPQCTRGLSFNDTFRCHDAPPAVVRAALDLLDPWFGTSRPNGQPPAQWLLRTAERLGGLAAGIVAAGEEYQSIRVDAVCVPGERGQELAAAVDQDWPDVVLGSPALDVSLAEEWDSWDAERPTWEGNGRELLAGRPPAVAVGLWWD